MINAQNSTIVGTPETIRALFDSIAESDCGMVDFRNSTFVSLPESFDVATLRQALIEAQQGNA